MKAVNQQAWRSAPAPRAPSFSLLFLVWGHSRNRCWKWLSHLSPWNVRKAASLERPTTLWLVRMVNFLATPLAVSARAFERWIARMSSRYSGAVQTNKCEIEGAC